MIPHHRFARTALLLVGSAALAGTVALIATPSHIEAKVPPLDALPWSVSGTDRPDLPVAILYVDERCSHCGPAAREASASASASGATLLVVGRGSRDSTRDYGRRLALRSPIGADTSGALGRALGVRAVPALFLFARDGQRAVLVGFRGGDYARALRRLR